MTGDRRLYDTAEAAAELGVPAHAIAVWRNRKKIIEADSIPGPGRRGRVPLWDLEDLRPLAEAYHRRVATRRARTERTVGGS